MIGIEPFVQYFLKPAGFQMFALRLYQRAMARRPMLTQAISAGALAGLGDGFSQVFVEGRRKRDYDPIRTASLRLLEGRRLDGAIGAAREKFWPILMTNYKVWPFVQLVNFYFIPLYYQLIFVQAVGIFWNAYLSFMTQATPALQSF
ncbi:unnamed protein product [Enterobius vermicularis]|uniref:Mitochondrial inner membrane protein Mpv17 n=1 Tax=Enterobius vermicularis TaxID=51028 RepID=A0A0N4UYR5_ENTVE|nr:unnamed protein product [Enterobius vermicularis]